MKIVESFDSLKNVRKPVVLAAGFFDGLHRGHLRVISETLRRARELNGYAWVFTFREHPRQLLDSSQGPELLTSTRHKMKLLDALGVDTCMLIHFTRRIAGISPVDFVDDLCGRSEYLAEIVVGKNWRYGAGGKGDVDLLGSLARNWNVGVKVAQGATRHGRMISSTRIRSAVRKGDLREADAMLGRPFSVLGKVVKGRGIGEKMGFPTANLELEDEILPPNGVYAGFVRHREEFCKSALSLGNRPTFELADGGSPLLEAHMLDKDEDLYGEEMEVFFVRHIRQQRKYGSAGALQARMEEDARTTRRILSRKKVERIALHI